MQRSALPATSNWRRAVAACQAPCRRAAGQQWRQGRPGRPPSGTACALVDAPNTPAPVAGRPSSSAASTQPSVPSCSRQASSTSWASTPSVTCRRRGHRPQRRQCRRSVGRPGTESAAPGSWRALLAPAQLACAIASKAPSLFQLIVNPVSRAPMCRMVYPARTSLRDTRRVSGSRRCLLAGGWPARCFGRGPAPSHPHSAQCQPPCTQPAGGRKGACPSPHQHSGVVLKPAPVASALCKAGRAGAAACVAAAGLPSSHQLHRLLPALLMQCALPREPSQLQTPKAMLLCPAAPTLACLPPPGSTP